ncbi:MAG: methionine synthase, partial [Anaerolineales bacterium]|nr:methionine synthase [Anaerolineales bacterium]
SAGLPSGMPPEAWLLENPDPVRDVHTAYLDAGADLILTCTFGGTRTRLERKGFADRVTQINHRAVEIARQAAAGRAYVAGDIGPLGQFLVPIGTLTPDEAIAAFAEQATALVEAGVDALYIETMSAMEEMHAAVEAAQQAAAGRNLPIFATFSFDHRGRTNMGVGPEQAAHAFVDWQLTAFGANCGATLEMTNAAISTMHAVAPDAWLIAKPNAGIPHTVGGDVIYDATPEDMAIAAARFIDLGVRVVGGCCGSTPAHIAAVAAAVRR